MEGTLLVLWSLEDIVEMPCRCGRKVPVAVITRLIETNEAMRCYTEVRMHAHGEEDELVKLFPVDPRKDYPEWHKRCCLKLQLVSLQNITV